MEDDLAVFRHWLVERQCAATTVWQYLCKLRALKRELQATGEGFSRAVVIRWLERRQRDGLRPRTIHGDYTAFAAFARFLLEHGRAAPDLRAIRLPPLDAPQRYTPSREEVAALFALAERLPGHRPYLAYRRAQTLALLALYAYCALRAHEALALDLSDLHREGETWELRVRWGKGGKARGVVVPGAARRHLEAYLPHREHYARGLTALFPARRQGERMGDDGLRTLWADLEAHAAALGQPLHPQLGPHSLRHWAATTMYDLTGGNLKVVQAHLGHGSAQTTWLYIHSTQSEVEAAAEALSRLAEGDTPGGGGTGAATPAPADSTRDQGHRPQTRGQRPHYSPTRRRFKRDE